MDPKNISTLIKPPEVSSITQEENENMHNKLSKLEEQLNNLSARSIKGMNWKNHKQKLKKWIRI
jgi:hypothetical protein